jgi:glycosyltransferase involved in cell wall biosynthesis
MKKLKINILIGPFYPIPPVLGLAVERIHFALAAEYVRRGHDVTMVSRRYDGFPNEEVTDGIRHIRIKSSNEPKNRLLYRLYDILYCLRARRALPTADVTITNSVSAPIILNKRAFGAIYVNVGRFPKGQMGLYRRAARLQAVSTVVGDAISEQTPTVASLVKVIANPLDQRFLDAAAKGQPAERAQEILYVGRIAHEKGLHLLVEAFARVARQHPDWTLTVVGPTSSGGGGDGDDYLSTLRASADRLGVKINFEPPVYDVSLLSARMMRASVFVYPSISERGESFGLAPLEAMACGCAVVVSQLECFSEFVKPGENALVFDHRDDEVANLTSACLMLIEDSALRTSLARFAVETSHDFAPGKIAEAMIDDFRELTSGRQVTA